MQLLPIGIGQEVRRAACNPRGNQIDRLLINHRGCQRRHVLVAERGDATQQDRMSERTWLEHAVVRISQSIYKLTIHYA